MTRAQKGVVIRKVGATRCPTVKTAFLHFCGAPQASSQRRRPDFFALAAKKVQFNYDFYRHTESQFAGVFRYFELLGGMYGIASPSAAAAADIRAK